MKEKIGNLKAADTVDQKELFLWFCKAEKKRLSLKLMKNL